MRAALDSTPLTLTSGGLARYVTELHRALTLAFPEDTFTLLTDQDRQLSGLHKRWWLYGLPRLLRESGVQVFHGTNFEVPYLGRTPSVMTVHDLSPWKNPEWHSNARRVRRRTPLLLNLGRARRILTPSEAVRREVISHFRQSPEKVHAVPLAAADFFRPVDVPPVHPRPFFLFTGTLEPRKNVTGLIEAWQQAQTGIDLILAGRRRADAPSLTAMAGLHFAGEVPDEQLAALYSQALAFVYPTFYEGFGLPVLEAMQCGCPVITSQDSAVQEVSKGAAIHAGSTAELANALRQTAADANLRRAMREAGLLRARAFSWQETARQTRAVYELAVRH